MKDIRELALNEVLKEMKSGLNSADKGMVEVSSELSGVCFYPQSVDEIRDACYSQKELYDEMSLLLLGEKNEWES